MKNDLQKTGKILSLLTEIKKELEDSTQKETVFEHLNGQLKKLSFLMDTIFEFDKKYLEEIPPINFPSNWSVKIIPPMHGSVSRFWIYDEKGEHVSISLDGYRFINKEPPSWECYPINGTFFKCNLQQTKKLIREIQKEFERRKQN